LKEQNIKVDNSRKYDNLPLPVMNYIKTKNKKNLQQPHLEALLRIRLNGPAFNTMDFSKFAKEYIDRGHHPCEHPFEPPRKQRKPSLDPNGDEENTHFASTFSALYNI